VLVYVAAPLFCDAEKQFNVQVAQDLAALGVRTYLPQRDSGETAALVKEGWDRTAARRRLFDSDVAAVRACDALLIILDGRVPDEGACVELGMAYAWGKTCLGLQTDVRRFGGGSNCNNLMVDHALIAVVHTLEELGGMVSRHLREMPITNAPRGCSTSL
jgi:nucleoside 2-deoxyribosyltransferase